MLPIKQTFMSNETAVVFTSCTLGIYVTVTSQNLLLHSTAHQAFTTLVFRKGSQEAKQWK